MGSVLAEPESKNLIQGLLAESAAVAGAMGVILPNDLKRAHFERITQKEDRMETTSLSRDIVLGRAGELELFSGFLIDMAKKYAPYYTAQESLLNEQETEAEIILSESFN